MSFEEELPCDVTRVDTRSFDDFPLEMIALIADFVDNFDDLARMSLVSHHVRYGVLLSRQWIIVREVVEATEGNVAYQRRYLHDRIRCANFAYKKGLLRLLRVLNLLPTEVLHCRVGHIITKYGQLDVLKYMCATYALTPTEVMALGTNPNISPVYTVVSNGHMDLVRYLHSCGVTILTNVLSAACFNGRLEILKWLHTDVGFTAEDVRLLDMMPLFYVVLKQHRDCAVYLRTGYGLTQDDARRALLATFNTENVMISEVFELG